MLTTTIIIDDDSDDFETVPPTSAVRPRQRNGFPITSTKTTKPNTAKSSIPKSESDMSSSITVHLSKSQKSKINLNTQTLSSDMSVKDNHSIAISKESGHALSECPICNISSRKLSVPLEQHVNECLDGIPKNDNTVMTSSFDTISPDLTSRDYTLSENDISDLSFCVICGYDLTSLPDSSRQLHVNRCLDDTPSAKSRPLETPATSGQSNKPAIELLSSCPICSQSWIPSPTRTHSLAKRLKHLKECAKKNNILIKDLLLIASRGSLTTMARSTIDSYFSRVVKSVTNKSFVFDEGEVIAKDTSTLPLPPKSTVVRPSKSVFSFQALDDDDDFKPSVVRVTVPNPHAPVSKKQAKKMDKLDEELQIALGMSSSLVAEEEDRAKKAIEFGGYVFERPDSKSLSTKRQQKKQVPVELLTAEEAMEHNHASLVKLVKSGSPSKRRLDSVDSSSSSGSLCVKEKRRSLILDEGTSDEDVILIDDSDDPSSYLWDMARTAEPASIIESLTQTEEKWNAPGNNETDSVSSVDISVTPDELNKIEILKAKHAKKVADKRKVLDKAISALKEKYESWVKQEELLLAVQIEDIQGEHPDGINVRHTSMPPSTQGSITPTPERKMPDYNSMSIKQLYEIADSYGLRHGPKSSLVESLTSIWQTLHDKISHTADDKSDAETGTMELSSQAPTSNLPRLDSNRDLDNIPLKKDDPLKERLHQFLRHDKSLYRKVITYEPLDVDDLYVSILHEDSLADCSKKDLQAFLDEHGIISFQPETRSKSRRKK